MNYQFICTTVRACSSPASRGLMRSQPIRLPTPHRKSMGSNLRNRREKRPSCHDRHRGDLGTFLGYERRH